MHRKSYALYRMADEKNKTLKGRGQGQDLENFATASHRRSGLVATDKTHRAVARR